MIVGLIEGTHKYTWNQALKAAEARGHCLSLPYGLIKVASQQRIYTEPSMSQIFADCPRRAVLGYLIDHFVSPEACYFMNFGTLVHNALAQVDFNTWITLREQKLCHRLPSGLYVSGTPDLYEYKTAAVTDYKTTRTSNKTWPRAEHVGQINGYAWLYTQEGLPVRRLVIFYLTFFNFVPYLIAKWSEEKILAELNRRAPVIAAAYKDFVVPPQCPPGHCNTCQVREFCQINCPEGRFQLAEKWVSPMVKERASG